jgi:hypothetical protein
MRDSALERDGVPRPEFVQFVIEPDVESALEDHNALFVARVRVRRNAASGARLNNGLQDLKASSRRGRVQEIVNSAALDQLSVFSSY